MSPLVALALAVVVLLAETVLPSLARAVDPEIGRAAKDLGERCLAVAGLLALLPLLLVLALAVRSSSRGPVLFRQRRIGEGGREFELLKLRSMHPAVPSPSRAAAGAAMAPGGVEGVDRRTGVGRLLRRSSLDELPQLWNVVRGEMVLVGPRPERPGFVERFSAEVPGYAARHRVRVGLTASPRWRARAARAAPLGSGETSIEHTRGATWQRPPTRTGSSQGSGPSCSSGAPGARRRVPGPCRSRIPRRGTS